MSGEGQSPSWRAVVSTADGAPAELAVTPGIWPAGTAEGEGVRLLWLGEPRLRHGEDFRDPDFGVILARLWREHGAGLLDALDGAWLLVAHDAVRHETVAAVDRFATFELYWAEDGGRVALAGTGREAVAALGRNPEPDPQALYDYLFFHMVPAPYSAWRGVRRLGPGEHLRIAGVRAAPRRHWTPQYVEDGGETEALAAELRERLREAVARAGAEGACGAFLSGGTDSSAVAGLLAQARGGGAAAFSVGFDAPGYDEMQYARIAARHFGLRHREGYMRPADVAEAIPRIAAAYDEPYGNASAAAAWFCARMAAGEGVDVLLAGDGGDELFGGNARYLKQQVFEHWWRLPTPVRRPLEAAAPLLPQRPALLRKARSYILQARVPLPDRLESYNFLVRTSPAEALEPEFLTQVDTERPLEHLRARYGHGTARALVNRMMELDLRITLADNDLRKVRHMAEAAGVRVRFPMLDAAVLELAHRIPPRLHLAGGRLRAFYKDAMADFLPKEVLTKEKHGFGLPFGHWIHEDADLGALAREHLDGLAGRGIVRREWIDTLLAGNREHPHYYGEMLWVLVMLEAWFRRTEGTP